MSQTIDKRILQACEFIERRADQTITLEQLAKQVAMSPFHLQRKFSETLGVSPKQYQNAIRIQILKQSLRSGMDVTDAIFRAGFGSASRVYEQVNGKLGMTPSEYGKAGDGQQISFVLRETSLGQVIMAATDRGVCFVNFGDNHAQLLASLHDEFPAATLTATPESEQASLDWWVAALEHYIEGRGPRPNLPVELFGTAFQLSVWNFLLSIKDGETFTYKQVADAIGAPNAFRAVANACGANRVAVLVPCHRVLRGDGGLGGYRWGEARKRRLLDNERSLSELACDDINA